MTAAKEVSVDAAVAELDSVCALKEEHENSSTEGFSLDNIVSFTFKWLWQEFSKTPWFIESLRAAHVMHLKNLVGPLQRILEMIYLL